MFTQYSLKKIDNKKQIGMKIKFKKNIELRKGEQKGTKGKLTFIGKEHPFDCVQ